MIWYEQHGFRPQAILKMTYKKGQLMPVQLPEAHRKEINITAALRGPVSILKTQ